MKSIRRSLLAVLCLTLPAAFASAGDLDWSGTYRIEGQTIENPQAKGGSKKTKDYGVHHLMLRPKIVGADGLYINGQLDIFNSEAANGAWGNQLGAIYGNGVDNDATSASNSGNSNTLSEHEDAEQIRISQFYLTWVQEFGSLIAGRAPVQFGLGMTHSAGRGLFDHYADTRDLIGYKVVLGNFAITPMMGKVNEGGLGGFDDVNDLMLQAEYANPESDVEMGFMYWNRKAGAAGNDSIVATPIPANTDVFPGATGITGDYDYKLMSFYFGKKSDNYSFGIEVANQTGDTGVSDGTNGIEFSGMGLATEFEYHPKDKRYALGLKAGLATGDDKTTTDEYEGFIFDKNYDVAMLLFNHSLGQANLLHTEMAGSRISAAKTSSTLSDPDVEAISNVMYVAPYWNYKWSDKWTIRGVLATGILDQTKLAGNLDSDNALGYELDLSLNYSPNERVVWQNTFGYLMTGTAFEVDGTFSSSDVFGFMSRAAISF